MLFTVNYSNFLLPISISTTNQGGLIRERVKENDNILEYADTSYTRECTLLFARIQKIKSLLAHRFILPRYSKYFKTMFQTEIREKYADFVEIGRVDETSSKELINFIYAAKISINQDNVFGLLAASNDLKIDKTKQFCVEFCTCIL